jgi:hypothetical protein
VPTCPSEIRNDSSSSFCPHIRKVGNDASLTVGLMSEIGWKLRVVRHPSLLIRKSELSPLRFWPYIRNSDGSAGEEWCGMVAHPKIKIGSSHFWSHIRKSEGRPGREVVPHPPFPPLRNSEMNARPIFLASYPKIGWNPPRKSSTTSILPHPKFGNDSSRPLPF